MNVLEIIDHLRRRNIVARAEHEKLKLVGQTENLTEEFIQLIKIRKSELIAFLCAVSEQSSHQPILPAAPRGHYPATNTQKRLWLLGRSMEGARAYNIVTAFLLSGTLVPERLDKAFGYLIDRHEILRTVFREIEGEVTQVILDSVPFAVEFYKIGKSEGWKTRMKEELSLAADWRFDLSSGPLLRVKLFALASGEHAMIFGVHHIVSDGWSMGVMISELMQHYDGYLKNPGYQAAPLRIQYKDYACWLTEKYGQNKMSESWSFWSNDFSRVHDPLNLPFCPPRPDTRTYEGEFYKQYLEPALHQRILSYCASRGVSVFSFFRAALTALLSRLSDLQTIVIGTPVSGRNHADLEYQIGLYVNTVPLRIEVDMGNSFNEFLGKVARHTLEALTHQAFPFDVLVERLNVRYDSSRNPLFDVMMVMHDTASRFSRLNSERNYSIKLNSLDPFLFDTDVMHGRRYVKFDLIFNFSDDLNGRFFLEIEYITALFDKAAIDQIFHSFMHIIVQVLNEPDIPMCQLELVLPEEKNRLLNSFNDTGCHYLRHRTIVDMIEDQVGKTPGNVAIIFEGTKVTYAELNKRTNQLAYYLRVRHNIQRGDLIGVKLERSEWMIIAILAVLKSGAAYVPIDPDYPFDRIDFMMTNSNSTLLIDDDLLYRFIEEAHKYDITNPRRVNEENDLFYLIYTSGSAGLPKGAMVKHHSVVNLISWYAKLLSLQPEDCVLLMAPVSFDLAQKNIFTTLVQGATLCLPGKLYGDYHLLADTIHQNHVTVVNAAPSAFYPLLDTDVNANFSKLVSLKHVVLGGEPIQIREFVPWAASGYYNGRIVNTYGPTECTDVVSSYIVSNTELSTRKTVPIGVPVDNTSLYILDRHGKLVPVGIPGEIFISGVCVGSGYLNQHRLTSEKFLPDPFRNGELMYGTGDLGKWLPDGNIEYLGRKDNQLKIRGIRVEPGEIESALQTHPHIISSAVTGRMNSNGDMQLVAYVVGRKPMSRSQIKCHLNELLPAYMLPVHFVQMDKLPLTPSGKIDKKALPDPHDLALPADTEPAPPANETEATLLSIWKSILEREDFGVKDNFFDLGGNSITILRMVNQVNRHFSKKISAVTAFQCPNINSLSAYILDSSDMATMPEDDTSSVNVMEETLNLINRNTNEK